MATPPIAQFAVDAAAAVALSCHRNEARFLRPLARSHVAERLVAETHDARWRFSASATVGPLAASVVAK